MIRPLLEARAKIQKYFCLFFGSNENFKICFRDLLTFRPSFRPVLILHYITSVSYTFCGHTGPLTSQGCRSWVGSRYLSRFFDRWAHETTYAYIGNKHFFTKACHHQTYQNSKISWQKMPISDFQSDFSMSKIIRIFLNSFFIEEYQFRGMFFVIDIFCQLILDFW